MNINTQNAKFIEMHDTLDWIEKNDFNVTFKIFIFIYMRINCSKTSAHIKTGSASNDCMHGIENFKTQLQEKLNKQHLFFTCQIHASYQFFPEDHDLTKRHVL